MKASEKAYKELEYLAVKYANKLYSYVELFENFHFYKRLRASLAGISPR